MSPGDPEVRRFLAGSLVTRIATLSRRGEPALTPIWFVLHRERIFLGTARHTLAARNAAANPDVVLLFDGETLPGSTQILRLYGRAVVRDRRVPWPVLLGAARKYYLSPGGLRCELAHAGLWRLRSRYYGHAEPALIEIEPVRAEFLRRPD